VTAPSNPTSGSQHLPVACAGLVVADLFLPPLDAMPGSGEIVTVPAPLSDVGGCAANTATALVALGVETALAARVGSDALGQWVRETLTGKGVDVFAMGESRLPTSQTVIVTIRGDDRRYIHSVGANAELTAEEIALVSEYRSVLVVGGFFALPALTSDQLAKVFAEARSRGTLTVLDIVVPHGAPLAAEQLMAVLPHVDCFMPNQDEARELTGESDPVRQAAALLEWGCGAVIITKGSNGALFMDAENLINVHPLEVDFVDGSGAGDAFAAGIVVGLREKWPIGRTLRFAAAVGASVTRGLGCTSTLFTREEALSAAERVVLTPPTD